MALNPRFFLIARLGEEDLEHLKDSDCGDSAMNDFFRDECFYEQNLGLNSTYVLYYKGELAALCSICTDKLSLAKDEKNDMSLPRNSVPAVKNARLARDVKFHESKIGIYLL